MRTDLMDPRDALEAAEMFAKPIGGELMPSTGGAPNITIVDQIITAQKVGVERDLTKIMRDIKTMAAMAGDDWYYRFPVKKKGGGVDHIEGPTIKCATNVARMYGNCQVDVRVQDQGASWLIYARFVDYESGFSLTRPFQADKAKGTLNTKDAGRQQEIALAIGVSKATRNVITNALEAFTTFAFDEAKKNLVEKVGKRLDEYRARVRERLAQIGVDEKRVEAVLGRAVAEWLAPDVARVIAELKAVADGMATADETWPPPAPPEPKRGDFTEKPKAAEPAKAETQPAEKVEDAGKTDEQSPPSRPWKISDSVVGQEPRRRAILELLDLAKVKVDIDEIEEEHREFLGKLGRTKAETMQAFEARRAELPERLEEEQ